MKRINFETATAEEIIDAMTTLVREKQLIDDQLDEARRRAAATGEYSDSEWYCEAQRAAKVKGWLHQKGQAELSRRERAAKEERIDSTEFRFMDAAKRILDEDTFYMILSECKK